MVMAEPSDAPGCFPGACSVTSGKGCEGFVAAASLGLLPTCSRRGGLGDSAACAPLEGAHVPPHLHAFPQGCMATSWASSGCHPPPPPPPSSVLPSRTRNPATSACPQPRTIPGDFLTGLGEQGDPLASLPTTTQSFLLDKTRCPAGCSQPALLIRFVCWAVPRDHWLSAWALLGVCPALLASDVSSSAQGKSALPG